MRANDVLSVWERGERGTALDHTLAILTGPLELDAEVAEALPLGERDRQILGLHAAMFGGVLHASCRCPRCAERLTFDLPPRLFTDTVPADTATRPAESVLGPGAGVHVLEADNLKIEFRLPNTADVRAASEAPDILAARDVLVQRCVLRALRGGEPIDLRSSITEHELELLAAQMTASDPLVETLLQLHCPACAHEWEAVVDLGEFFWAELTDLAGRLLHEVHVLARAFHWSESDILAMSPRRRRLYLELAEA